MNSIINAMPKYDHRQHILSDWLAELDQCFQLGEVGEDTNKITWCQLLIGATESGILCSLDEATTWKEAKETLLTCLGTGSVRDEAWAALKNLKKGTKDIVELAGEAEKLAKRLHPRDKEAAERHAVNAFLVALEKTLAAEVQKLGHRTMEDVVAAARRIEKILEEQSDSKVERLIRTMQDQIWLLKKDLREANDQITAHKANAPTAPLFPHLPQQPPPPPLKHRLLLLLATSTRITARNPILPPSPPSNGSSTTTLLPMRRRRPLHVQLSCPPSPSTPPPPTSTSQCPCPARGQILELPTSEDDPHPNSNVHLNC